MIGNLISSIVCVIFFTLSSKLFFKFNEKKLSFAIVAVILVIIKILSPVRANPQLNLCVSLGTYLIIQFFYFVGSIKIKIFYVFLFIVFSSLCDIFTMKIYTLFFNINVLTNDFTFILGVITTNIMLFYILYVVSLYWQIFKLKIIPKYSWLLLSLPITTLILMINVDDYYFVLTNSNDLVLIFFGLLLSNISCIYIYYKTVINISKKNALEKELQEKNIEYQAAVDLLSQHNIFLHDIRNHSATMLKLLKKCNYDELSYYIENVYSDSTNIFNMINSNYKVVDLIINDRIYIIKNNNIQLRIKLEETDFKSYSVVEMEKIFKTVIDLAINQCISSMVSNPFILIKSKKIAKQIILTFAFNSNSIISIELLGDEIKEIFEVNSIYYLIENDEISKESNISILFQDGELNE